MSVQGWSGLEFPLWIRGHVEDKPETVRDRRCSLKIGNVERM